MSITARIVLLMTVSIGLGIALSEVVFLNTVQGDYLLDTVIILIALGAVFTILDLVAAYVFIIMPFKKQIQSLNQVISQIILQSKPSQQPMFEYWDELQSLKVSLQNLDSFLIKLQINHEQRHQDLIKENETLQRTQVFMVDREKRIIDLKQQLAEIATSQKKT